jgi:hypothetical protein
MTAKVIESLVQENRLLQNQVNQIRYFLAGSHGLKVQVSDVQVGQSLYCGKDEMHQIAAGLLAPSVTCADIGPGLRPQRMLDCPVHVLVEPWRPYADILVSTYPGKVVVNSFATPYLSSMLDRSIDTIFLLDVIEHIEKEEGRALLRNACRVARVQVVLFTPLGFMPHEVHDTPPEWGDVQHGTTQRHLSGWMPEELPPSMNVICENFHLSSYGTFGAFYSIIPIQEAQKPRLVLVSEELPEWFRLAPNDVLVIDVRFTELSHLINSVPKHNALVVPLELIAEQPGVPLEMLRRTMINLAVLVHHLEQFEAVEAFGAAARAVLHRLRKHLDSPA